MNANPEWVVAGPMVIFYHPTAKFNARFEELRESLRREFFFMPYAPVIAVSARDRQYLGKVFSTIEKIRAASDATPGTGVLNRLLAEAIERTPPPAIKGHQLKLLYATLARPPDRAPSWPPPSSASSTTPS